MWNRSEPEDDSQFANRYTTSEVAHLENILYGQRAAADRRDGSNRPLADPPDRCSGLNFTGDAQADLLRLNTSIKPGVNGACPGGTASAAAPDRMAVLDGRPLRVPERPPPR